MVLYLDVMLNKVRHPQLVAFELHGGDLHASGQALRALGFHLPASEDAESVSLASIPGVHLDYDAARQRVEILAPLDALALATSRLGRRGTPEAPLATDAPPGVILNYNLYASHGGGTSAVSATTELRAFGVGRGVFKIGRAHV